MDKKESGLVEKFKKLEVELLKVLSESNSDEINLEQNKSVVKSQLKTFAKKVDKARKLFDEYELIAQHTQNLFTLKTQLEENTKKFNKEFDNISNNKLFQNIEQLREYGIQLNSKKVGKKVNEIEIHKDFIN